MKNIFTRTCLGLIALAFCFLISETPTSANFVKSDELQNYFEKSEVIEGELEIIAECEENDGRMLYFVNTASGRVPLQLSNSPEAQLTTGSLVRVKGTYIGDSFVATDGVEKLDSELTAPDLLNTTGEHRVLVILVNFQDNQEQPYSIENARDVVFTQTSDLYREMSYGQTWLTGDVYGWYTIPVSYTICDKSLIATYAQQAAAAAGADLSAYNHYVFGFPQNGCTFSGSSTVGGNPSSLWLNATLASSRHEMGHSFGLVHSHSLDCGSVVIGGTCTTSEYGDRFDIMGASNYHYNLSQKERLGWTSPQTVTSSGTYWMDAYETIGGIKGLKILKSVDPVTGSRTWYYLEHRIPFGADSTISSYPNVVNGVLFRIGSDGNDWVWGPSILDMTPLTASWYDPALTVGQTFSDPDAGVTITTLSADSTGAFVNVSIAAQACVRSNPTLTVSQAQSPWVTAGSTVSFNLTVRNNDTGGCGASAYNLQAHVPAGWNAVFSAQAPLIEQGASAATTLQITSPVGATEGTYPINITAVNTSAPTSGSSTTVTYSLLSGLAVTAAATQTSYTRNQTATVNATVLAGGAPVAGAPVTFTMTKSNGAVITTTRTTGTNGVATFIHVLSRKKDPLGLYQVRAQASASGMSGVGNTSFTVR